MPEEREVEIPEEIREELTKVSKALDSLMQKYPDLNMIFVLGLPADEHARYYTTMRGNADTRFTQLVAFDLLRLASIPGE